MSHDQTIPRLRDALSDLRLQKISVAQFCVMWRAQTGLLADLPQRYAQVMEDLLGRLEAGSLFTEESCSFSQQDLLDGLESWLGKAQQTLAARAA
jgi:hypothetical protein